VRRLQKGESGGARGWGLSVGLVLWCVLCLCAKDPVGNRPVSVVAVDVLGGGVGGRGGGVWEGGGTVFLGGVFWAVVFLVGVVGGGGGYGNGWWFARFEGSPAVKNTG